MSTKRKSKSRTGSSPPVAKQRRSRRHRIILAIDGGGIRGIIPALVLAHIEAKIGAPIATCVDLIAGTSTGGILALGLTKRTTREGARRAYSASELVDLYENHGKEIFHRSLWKGITSAGSYVDERYDHQPFERILQNYFGEDTIGSATARVMVTTYDIQAREPYFFKSWKSDRSNVPMRVVARATSAAPTYFEPARVRVDGLQRTLIDGGVFANNPAMSAYAELLRDKNNTPVRVISLGTGEMIRPIRYEEARGWGKLNWALPILSCIFDGVGDAVTYELTHLLGDNFVRLQVELSLGNDDMDDATDGNIQNLKMDAERLIAANKREINKICEWLRSS